MKLKGLKEEDGENRKLWTQRTQIADPRIVWDMVLEDDELHIFIIYITFCTGNNGNFSGSR